MPASLAFALFITVVHVAIYFTSGSKRRPVRALCGSCLALAGFASTLAGPYLAGGNMVSAAFSVLAVVLPLASLLVYLPALWNKNN